MKFKLTVEFSSEKNEHTAADLESLIRQVRMHLACGNLRATDIQTTLKQAGR